MTTDTTVWVVVVGGKKGTWFGVTWVQGSPGFEHGWLRFWDLTRS